MTTITSAVILDMDGLLFDTEWLYATATAQALVDIGYNPSIEFCWSLAGYSNDACESAIARYFGVGFPLLWLSEAYERRKAQLLSWAVLLKPGAMDFVRHIRRRGYPLALATGASRAVAMPYLEHHKMTAFFDAIVTREDVIRGKPAPDTYLVAAKRLGVSPSRCVVFEDSIPGVKSARVAGTTVVHVPDRVVVPCDVLRGCRVVSSLEAAVQRVDTILLTPMIRPTIQSKGSLRGIMF